MKEKIQMLLTIFVLLNEAKKQFKEFNNFLPTDVCDAEYVSAYYRSKFTEHLEDSAENLWAIIGKLAKFDLDTFLPIAVDYLTNRNFVLEKEETLPNDNPNEEDGYVQNFDND